MGYQSEAALERDVMNQLEAIGYERALIHTEDQLKENFRNLLNERHTKLKAEPLSDKEFSRLMTQINNKSVFDSAKILRDKFVLRRDDETEIYLELFDQKNFSNNIFQVTNQVSVNDEFSGRYDVTILLNGLPVVQVELKRRDVSIHEAFDQVGRYQDHNLRGLFRYVQMFIVSNYNDTRYFANSDKTFLRGLMFYWTDEENNLIFNLDEFMQSFLITGHLAKMISKYMIINESERKLMVMRPYQIYATEALIERALTTDGNGYVWHTTGSGKTLTSFKASQLLSYEPEISKVIFLVDRKDLDAQTQEEFNKFEHESVDETNSTKQLISQLEDKSRPMIITTIQKMSNAISKHQHVMEQYRKDKVIFVIDECHRSQFGDMHMKIKKHFERAQYFGFTGTPRFEENRSQDGRSTADIFDKCLHSYLVKDAIRDGNVLGFSIEYINTFKDRIREQSGEYVAGINTDEVWLADERIEKVARHIHGIHNNKTHNRAYVALMATQSIEMAMKYYRMFKAINAEPGVRPLKVATIFTYQPNQDRKDGDVKVHAKNELQSVIEDYNEIYGQNFSLDTYNAYFQDVSSRMKGNKAKEKIDILIVVDMFLTGFDSRMLNTLYVDKHLKHHNLIQAYSRTNRVDKGKKVFGNIVVYRNLKKETDEALRIFSDTENTDVVLSKSYEEYRKRFAGYLEKLQQISSTPASAKRLEDEEDIKEFILTFRGLARTLARLKTFEAFEFTEETVGMDEQEYKDYEGIYKGVYYEHIKREREGQKVSILDEIDFDIEVVRNDRVNVNYIRRLIENIELKDKKQQAEEKRQIKLLLEQTDDQQLRNKAELIREFLDKVVPHLEKNDKVREIYLNFEEERKLEEINRFSEEMNYPKSKLQKLISEYEFSGHLYNDDIEAGISAPFLERIEKLDKVRSFIESLSDKYGFVE
ncbi:type I restriction endonuclease subunit R [Salinicoccus roseus]|uniref:type I restriction endonuclease subunit R n=1 Tax=Salinicoccus roseus TaxID=45670 RepID=UPI00230111DD|nr:type I restriction endonuclease subunit R [Salinicoccus roseus]